MTVKTETMILLTLAGNFSHTDIHIVIFINKNQNYYFLSQYVYGHQLNLSIFWWNFQLL